MFPVIWILFPVLISSRTISMPLLDNLKATLKAGVDVTEMNEYLQAYIQEEVKTGVANALVPLVKDIVNNKTEEVELRITEKLQKEVKKGVTNALPTLVEDIVKKNTEEVELRITEKLQERQQYAFFATMSTNKDNLPEDSVVVFDQASLNVGEAYDNTTGKFTCKVDGLYTFSWTMLSLYKEDLTTVLITSGRRVVLNVVDTDETADTLSSSSTVVVRMRKGEQTWISVHKGDQLTAQWNMLPSSMFSGFKIN